MKLAMKNYTTRFLIVINYDVILEESAISEITNSLDEKEQNIAETDLSFKTIPSSKYTKFHAAFSRL